MAPPPTPLGGGGVDWGEGSPVSPFCLCRRWYGVVLPSGAARIPALFPPVRRPRGGGPSAVLPGIHGGGAGAELVVGMGRSARALGESHCMTPAQHIATSDDPT